jgi:serine phosphatase RsbU (regulator of sigma subunit)
MNYREVIWRNFEAFAKTYAALGNYKRAFDNYQLYANSRFEFDRQGTQLVELREQYESSKMAVQNLRRELKKQNQMARYEAAKNRQAMQIITLEMENKQQQLNKQRILIISFIVVLLIILVFSIIITKQYRQKHKAFKIVAKQKKHITDGISYAARIQSAVLPPEKHLENLLPEHFIINRPREQVGGDFYWAAKHRGRSVIAVADCTGHGVPGGFMSMLGIAILNEIISSKEQLETHEILTQLRVRVMDALHQKKGSAETMDGMDISLLIYDPKTRKIQFSGAYHTLYLIRNQEIELIKGDRIPIGYHFATKEFTSQNLQLEEGDMLYMTSDGFIDQIGEKSNKRFMYSRFKDELLSISSTTLIDQKKHLEEVLADWKGAQEQTDDILVMGLRV